MDLALHFFRKRTNQGIRKQMVLRIPTFKSLGPFCGDFEITHEYLQVSLPRLLKFVPKSKKNVSVTYYEFNQVVFLFFFFWKFKFEARQLPTFTYVCVYLHAEWFCSEVMCHHKFNHLLISFRSHFFNSNFVSFTIFGSGLKTMPHVRTFDTVWPLPMKIEVRQIICGKIIHSNCPLVVTYEEVSM